MSQGPEGSRAYVISLAGVAAIGGFLFGYDSGVINGAVKALQEAFGTGTAGTGFAVASVLLGCAVGAFGAGYLADHFGRKPMMLVTAVLFLASAIGSGAAGGVIFFSVVRLLGGLAVGAASVLAPAYIAEIAPPAMRGRLGSLQQLGIVLGLFSSFLCNYLIAGAAGGASADFWLSLPAWRWMFWAESVPAVAFLIGSLLIPESPRYLVAQGKDEEAARVFSRTAGGDPMQLVREVKDSLTGAGRGRLSDLLMPGTYRLRAVIWVGVGLSMFQQFVGINVVFYYGEVLWRAAGASEDAALLMNVVTGLTNIIATLIAIALIDRLGRKPLLLAGSLGMVVTLGGLTAAFTAGSIGTGKSLSLNQGAALVSLIAVNLYIVAFGVSWGPVVWVMLGEMFPNRFRGVALAVAASAQWLANFLVTVTFPSLLEATGLAGAYAVYAGAALLSLFFVRAFVPETKGKRLEEM
jgi:MFS transporter, SP family, sugar:H+ symporter